MAAVNHPAADPAGANVTAETVLSLLQVGGGSTA